MYDPYENVVYDYAGGMEDLKMAKVGRPTICSTILFFKGFSFFGFI
jgi:hypothetical protein